MLYKAKRNKVRRGNHLKEEALRERVLHSARVSLVASWLESGSSDTKKGNSLLVLVLPTRLHR